MTIYKNQSPWGSPPGSGGGSGNGGGFRRGPTPPNLDEAIKKLQDTINKFTGSGTGGKKPIILGLIKPNIIGFFPPVPLPVNLFIVSCNFLIASSKLGGVGPLLKPPPLPLPPPLPGGLPHGL